MNTEYLTWVTDKQHMEYQEVGRCLSKCQLPSITVVCVNGPPLQEGVGGLPIGTYGMKGRAHFI